MQRITLIYRYRKMSFNEARKIKQAQEEFLKSIDEMVTVMATDAVNHFKDSFTNQGFQDDVIEKWKPRKRIDRKRPGRGILIDTGKLRRSPTWRRKGKYEALITSNLPYANRHNEGLSGMTKRQFVGYSGVLNRRLVKKFDSRIKRIFK